ncbi:hypothetical protein Dsin_022424 [Dipteronia sinensis]|uniref:Cytochrome b/b6 N-terminal region profile domain-containing protein n=1 Tax=Dipteronia sinensis TaxID=43782 RepID=A0AAE0A1J3_9ROSI|nr:hypothetical protein Dsin_022424 [Dipteronia sinensis]
MPWNERQFRISFVYEQGIRSVHRWSASMMVLMIILHVFHVYLTGGFKKPRKLTWVTGVVLAVLTASFGVPEAISVLICVKGPGYVTAQDILLPPSVEIVDNTQHIANLTEPTDFCIGLQIERNRG